MILSGQLTSPPAGLITHDFNSVTSTNEILRFLQRRSWTMKILVIPLGEKVTGANMVACCLHSYLEGILTFPLQLTQRKMPFSPLNFTAPRSSTFWFRWFPGPGSGVSPGHAAWSRREPPLGHSAACNPGPVCKLLKPPPPLCTSAPSHLLCGLL